MESSPHVFPRPLRRLTAWLSAPARPAAAEVAEKLLEGMFRRLEAVLASAVATVLIAAFVTFHHPYPPFMIWLALDAIAFGLRVFVVVHLMRRRAYPQPQSAPPSWVADAFILLGTAWSALTGYGTYITFTTHDPGLIVIAMTMATCIVGGQCGRNPSSPRMNSVQMALIVIPMAIGAATSTLPHALIYSILIFIYVFALSNINRQLHEDYVALLVAQIDNRRYALHCPLTGLPNRRALDERLKRAPTTPGPRGIALFCLDLDGFKHVNDEHGHPTGDRLLIAVGERLNQLAADDDIVVRLGGDEFAILMRFDDPQRVETTARSIVVAFERCFALADGRELQVGASIGVAMRTQLENNVAIDAAQLLSEADHALYDAKRDGKGTFRMRAA